MLFRSTIGFDQHPSKESTEKERLAFMFTCSPPLLQFFKLQTSHMRSLSPHGAEDRAVPLSAPPRGLKNFRCENWMQRFRFACFRFCNAFVYLQRVSVFGCVLCRPICIAFAECSARVVKLMKMFS